MERQSTKTLTPGETAIDTKSVLWKSWASECWAEPIPQWSERCESGGYLRGNERSGFMIQRLGSDVLLMRPLDSVKGDPDLSKIREVLELDKDSFVQIWAYIEETLRSIIENENERVVVLWRNRDQSLHDVTSADQW